MYKKYDNAECLKFDHLNLLQNIMKIAIDLRNIDKGRTGDEVVFFELVRHLALCDTKNEYHLLIDDRTTEACAYIVQRLGIAQKNNFSLVELGTGNKFIWNAWSVARYCRKNHIDIYHTQYIIPIFMSSHTKIVTHIHDVSFVVYKNLIRKTDAFFLNILVPYALRHADHVIAVSQFTKDEIMKYYHVPDTQISVVHNAVSMQCCDVEKDVVRKKYHLPQKYILALGTMQPRKNIPLLIAAFVQIADKIPEVCLVLVGKKAHNFDPAIEKILLKNRAVKDRIIFTGYVDEEDKCMIYTLAKVFVFPSLYEGFGVPLLEAFEARTLVIASNIAPHREVAGAGAMYFDPVSIDQCKKILYDVLVNDNIKRNSFMVAQQQKKNFSWERSACILQRIYQSLV